MATQTTLYSKAIREKANELVARSDRWARGTARVGGQVIDVVLFTSSRDSSVIYMTRADGRGCGCPAAQRSRAGRCCHKLAATIVNERWLAAFSTSMSAERCPEGWSPIPESERIIEAAQAARWAAEPDEARVRASVEEFGTVAAF